MPKLSIIIPVYNAKDYLSECINSILSQSYKDIEILLIDDGSTDISSRLCDEYAEKYEVISVFHKKNGGVSSARNLGIEKSQGRYLFFVDSDDWLAKDILSKLMQLNMIADLTFVGSSFHFPDNKQVSYILNSHLYNGSSEIQLGMLNLIYNLKHPDYLGFTWNKIFKRSIIKEYNIHFIENLSYREDELFTLQYAFHCSNLMTVPDILYHYRVSSTGLTKRKKKESEFLLLSNGYMDCLEQYSNNDLKTYISLQITRFLLDATKRISKKNIRNTVINKLWTFARLQNIPYEQLQIKPIYKFLLNLPSPLLLKAYMLVKLLFKSHSK